MGKIPWRDRERLLDECQIHVGWICGLPYDQKADQAQPTVELLAVPVMQGPRYQDRPIYFSDVVVRPADKYAAFADLRGATWVLNEIHSRSGDDVPRCHLATLGEITACLAWAVAAGSHLRALAMILDGRVDATAIDSTVLELANRPELRETIRIVEVLGPSSIPL